MWYTIIKLRERGKKRWKNTLRLKIQFMDYRILRKLKLKIPEETEKLLKVLPLFTMKAGWKSDTWMIHTKLYVFT